MSQIQNIRDSLGTLSIVFVGMMGAGKSSVGSRLAARLGLKFVDADTEIVIAAGGLSIPELFGKYGESAFRDLEARVISRLLHHGPLVLATGGGAFMNAGTRDVVRSEAISVWLKADVSVLLERVMRKGSAARPMLNGDDPAAILKRLLDLRTPFYAEADLTIVSQAVPHEEVVQKVLDVISAHFNLLSGSINPNGCQIGHVRSDEGWRVKC